MQPALDLDPIPFTPVPTVPRHDGWTPARQRAFIDALGLCGMVAAAAREVGMTPKSAYRLRQRAGAESFAAAWDMAVDQGRAVATDAAITRAIEGVAEPVFRGGLQVGERRRYNDGLLIAVLRHLKPATADANANAALADFLGSSHSAGDVP